MKKYRVGNSLMLFAVALAGLLSARAQDKAPATTIPVQKTVSVRVVGDDKRMPEVNLDDVSVKRGKTDLRVTGWTPARGDRAGLDLFILIDDSATANLASQYDDLRAFINAQPETTSMGLGYMRNGTVQIKQNFTTDHSLVANTLRLPMGTVGAYGSPYLSVIDLMKRWPANYVYGVEFVEVDPVFELGTEQVHLPDPLRDARLQQDLKVDRELYHGLHGTAILSRYPIRSARILRLPVCYDWYGQEAKESAKLEQGKQWAARKLFNERIEREIRRGGRMALIADVAIPESPTGTATIVAVHLENKCTPACRRRQMQALLANIKQDQNPVIMAGDLNTTGKNNMPTSVRDEIMSRVTDYKFWAGQAVSHFHPLGSYQYALVPVHYFHGYQDPTAFHLPILWDNRECPLFRTVENFRFDDERAFDFRGDPNRTLNRRSRTLANSNERAAKGFVPTYAFSRDYRGLVGRFKLDWVFVKPFIQDPRLKDQSYFFAPHFAQTMRELNDSVEDRISDHSPMTVDLPLIEPVGQSAP